MSKRPPSNALQPGMVINDRYEIVAKIGQGGMSSVYEVHDRALDNERLALKLYSCVDRDPTMLERFKNEARLTRRLLHPNIVRTFEFGETEHGIQFLILEFVEGKTLRQISRESKLTIIECVDILRQIASAVDYSHSEGVLHRDLKSENILLKPDGTVKISDFGLARAVRPDVRLTAENEVVGTPLYMPPELIQGKDSDKRADIYALGILAYEMATQNFPYFSENWFELANKVIREQMPPFADEQNFPDWYESLAFRAAAKEPEKRFSSGRQLIDFMDSQGGLKIVESISRSLEILPPPTERSWAPVLVSFCAVIFLALTVGFVSLSVSTSTEAGTLSPTVVRPSPQVEVAAPALPPNPVQSEGAGLRIQPRQFDRPDDEPPREIPIWKLKQLLRERARGRRPFDEPRNEPRNGRPFPRK